MPTTPPSERSIEAVLACIRRRVVLPKQIAAECRCGRSTVYACLRVLQERYPANVGYGYFWTDSQNLDAITAPCNSR